MSHRTNNTDKDPDHVYECQQCGSRWPGSTISNRPDTGRPYCRTCQSEALELATLEQAERVRPRIVHVRTGSESESRGVRQ